MSRPDPAAEMGAVSNDGEWFWDGLRWSARHETVMGSVIPRMLAWTVLGALPLGGLISIPIAPLLSTNRPGAVGFGVAVAFLAAEALVAYIVLRRTPRITIDHGEVNIGRLFQNGRVAIPVRSIRSVEIVRGSMATLAVTEGFAGEGRVLIHIVGAEPVELGWDAFAGQASRLAWLLGVNLVDTAAEARQRQEAARTADPRRQKRRNILIIVGVVAGLAIGAAFLFGPLAAFIFQMVTAPSHRT